jgi:hypothetical protein
MRVSKKEQEHEHEQDVRIIPRAVFLSRNDSVCEVIFKRRVAAGGIAEGSSETAGADR